MVEEIESFVFGGFSSRFWGLRKHINSLNELQIQNLPFYSWECISLKLKEREVDLVIKDQAQMNILLKFLIVQMKTVDGRRGTAKKLIEHIGQNMHLQKTFTKYQILRFRQKISFIAFKHKKTIQELLISQILVSYHHFVNLGVIKYSKNNQCKDHDLYGSITDSCSMKGLL